MYKIVLIFAYLFINSLGYATMKNDNFYVSIFFTKKNHMQTISKSKNGCFINSNDLDNNISPQKVDNSICKKVTNILNENRNTIKNEKKITHANVPIKHGIFTAIMSIDKDKYLVNMNPATICSDIKFTKCNKNKINQISKLAQEISNIINNI